LPTCSATYQINDRNSQNHTNVSDTAASNVEQTYKNVTMKLIFQTKGEEQQNQ